MSLATAQRALAQSNRDTMQKTASGKLTSGIMTGIVEGLEFAGDVADATGITKNISAWEDFESGQEYLDMESTGPKKMSQRLFSRPDEVYKDGISSDSKNKTFTADEIGSVGSLARSDLKAAYEGYMDGDLSSKFGTTTSALNIESEEMGNTGLFNYDDTLTQIYKNNNPSGTNTSIDGEARGIGKGIPGMSSGEGLMKTTSSTDRKYTSLEKPKYSDNSLAPIADDNQFQVGTASGNKKIEKYLRNELGMKGKGLSSMIPGWSGMDETERLNKLSELGYSPGQEPSLTEKFQQDLDSVTSSINNKKTQIF